MSNKKCREGTWLWDPVNWGLFRSQLGAASSDSVKCHMHLEVWNTKMLRTLSCLVDAYSLLHKALWGEPACRQGRHRKKWRTVLSCSFPSLSQAFIPFFTHGVFCFILLYNIMVSPSHWPMRWAPVTWLLGTHLSTCTNVKCIFQAHFRQDFVEDIPSSSRTWNTCDWLS